MATMWTVPRDWEGETCAILASGASMTRADADYVRGRCRVIAVNNQGIPTLPVGKSTWVPALAPWADVLYATDARWWAANAPHSYEFVGLKVTLNTSAGKLPASVAQHADILALENGGRDGFDERRTHLRNGGNSGYAAIHLAAHFGANRILLLGFDMHGRHWFGLHRSPLSNTHNFDGWLAKFPGLGEALAARRIEVINCTMDSRIECFPKRPLRSVFPAAIARAS